MFGRAAEKRSPDGEKVVRKGITREQIEEVMSAKDTYHDEVVSALQADGWQITDDPYHVRVGDRQLFVDLGAEKIVAAEREGGVGLPPILKLATEVEQINGRNLAPPPLSL